MTILTPFCHRTSNSMTLDSKSLLDDLFDTYSTDKLREETPEVEVKKSESEYKIRAKLPGVKRDKLTIEIEDDYLKISGKYENEEEKDFELVHSEFHSSSEFYRALSLKGKYFKTEKIEAKLQDGLLEITLPLKEAEKPKQISIS